MNLFPFITRIAACKIRLLETLSPAVDLLIRLKMAWIFFASGMLKLPAGFLGIGKGDWDSTLYLFEEEYKLPLLSPVFAAYSSTFFEILCPILLVIGLGGRAAAFILLVMTIIAEFTYQSSPEHQFWVLLLLVIIFRGAGVLSLDHLIRKKSMLNL